MNIVLAKQNDPDLPEKLPSSYNTVAEVENLDKRGFSAIPTKAKLQELLDSVDKNGQKIPFEAGMTFISKKAPYEILRIEKLNEGPPQELTVKTPSGKEVGPPHPHISPFAWFFHSFVSSDPDKDFDKKELRARYTRIPKCHSYDEFASFVQQDGNLTSAF